MVAEKSLAPNSHRGRGFRPPATQPSATKPVLGAIPLVDRLVTYLELLASADSSVRRLQVAYTDRLSDVAAARRPDSTPERTAERERGREH